MAKRHGGIGAAGMFWLSFWKLCIALGWVKPKAYEWRASRPGSRD